MRLVTAFCLTASLAVSSQASAVDPSNPYYYQPQSSISPIADATFSDVASPPVSDGVAQSADTVPYDPSPVAHSGGACPHCGQHHHVPQTYYYYTYRQAEEPGFFSRVMDLERRKNEWLLSLIR